MEVEGCGGEVDYIYTYRYTVTTRMTPALRWAAMRAILLFHNYCEGQSRESVHRPQLLKRKENRRERRTEADSNRSRPAYQPNALPLGQTGSPSTCGAAFKLLFFYSLSVSAGAQWYCWGAESTERRTIIAGISVKLAASRLEVSAMGRNANL